MKHLVTLAALLTSLITLAQNPNYDPDSNGDDLIGAEDLMTFLGVYNTSLAVDTTLECEFDGTTEDEWLFGIFSGEVILDSMVVQFSISDSATYFEPGCPTQKVSYLNVEMEYVLPNFEFLSTTTARFRSNYTNPWESNQTAEVTFVFEASNGRAFWYWQDNVLNDLKITAPFNTSYNFLAQTQAMYSCVNAPSSAQTFLLNEDGVSAGITCNGTDFCCGVFAYQGGYNYFRLLPYWHYAE